MSILGIIFIAAFLFLWVKEGFWAAFWIFCGVFMLIILGGLGFFVGF